MGDKPTCSMCKKVIKGKIRVIIHKKKSNNKDVVEFFDEYCFKIKKRIKASNELRKQKRKCKDPC
jgi:hypothetical protein